MKPSVVIDFISNVLAEYKVGDLPEPGTAVIVTNVKELTEILARNLEAVE